MILFLGIFSVATVVRLSSASVFLFSLVFLEFFFLYFMINGKSLLNKQNLLRKAKENKKQDLLNK